MLYQKYYTGTLSNTAANQGKIPSKKQATSKGQFNNYEGSAAAHNFTGDEHSEPMLTDQQ